MIHAAEILHYKLWLYGRKKETERLSLQDRPFIETFVVLPHVWIKASSCRHATPHAVHNPVVSFITNGLQAYLQEQRISHICQACRCKALTYVDMRKMQNKMI